jgi:hypothetical protein
MHIEGGRPRRHALMIRHAKTERAAGVVSQSLFHTVLISPRQPELESIEWNGDKVSARFV